MVSHSLWLLRFLIKTSLTGILALVKTLMDPMISELVVLCDADRRERKAGEAARILKQWLLKGGFEPDMITLV